MAFDQPTRNRLARFVGEARAVLTEEFTRQLQHEYGLDPARGEVTEVAKLTQLDDARRETARILRETLAHYLAGQSAPTAKVRQEALDRLVREQAFTVLNRLCALRMAEARGLLIESIAKGYQSRGFQLYARLAGPALGETGEAYRAYLFSLFDEFSVDLAVLFDRFSPQGRLFPRASTLLQLLAAINHPDLEPLWAEDETIGWIYQFFNSIEERQKMRSASRSPRNSRELAVRNQFFTPRYVVEFLTDNTLGRIWYEMTQGQTSLVDRCRYLVRRPNEIFLNEGEEAPTDKGTGGQGDQDLTQEELLRQPVYIPFRRRRDPRTILMLDPACGSMHFGLYSFDLYEWIYEEAWEMEGELGAQAFDRPAAMAPLRELYTDKASFLRDVPRLIIEYNIHGIDIDPRAVQIAGLSLWLRAQKSWQAQGIKTQERPTIRKSNIVCAEPMPGDKALLEEFLQGLRDDRLEALIRRVLNVPENQRVRATPTMADTLCGLIRKVWEEMKLAGEAGSLLKIEEALKDAIAKGRAEWEERMPLFRVETFRLTDEKPTVNYIKVISDEDADFWERVEMLVLAALEEYAAQAVDKEGYQRRLFAEDAIRGFDFINLCRKHYQVVLMNPPFGEASVLTKTYIDENYANSTNDIFTTFVDCIQDRLSPMGYLGVISSRTGFFLRSTTEWREQVVLNSYRPLLFADLGDGVLDATVEAAAYVIRTLSEQESSRLTFALLSQLLTIEKESSTHFSIPKYQKQRGELKRYQALHELRRLLEAGYIRYIDGSQVRFEIIGDRIGEENAHSNDAFPSLLCFRLLVEQNKEFALLKLINTIFDNRRFIVDPQKFTNITGSPFIYWVKHDTLNRLSSYPLLEGNSGVVKVGLQTGNDTRFLRLIWEVPIHSVGSSSQWGKLSQEEFISHTRSQFKSQKRWNFYSKTDFAAPWVSPLTLVVDWKQDGDILKEYVRNRGYSPSKWVQSESLYFRPGFSYMLRSTRLVPYIVPAGVIPTAGRAQVYPDKDREFHLLGYCASNIASAVARFSGEMFARPKFQASMVQNLPISDFKSELIERISLQIELEVNKRRRSVQGHEPFQEFARPAILNDENFDTSWDLLTLIGKELEIEVAQAFGLNPEQLNELERDIREAVAIRFTTSDENSETHDDEDESDTLIEFVDESRYSKLEGLISYGVGVAFGRWDIRIGLNENLAPPLQGVFDPLPVCPPGMLVGTDGLPASTGCIVSEAWLLARPNAISISSEGSFNGPATINDDDYPIVLPWNGIIANDTEYEGSIEHCVINVLDILLSARSELVIQEAFQILGISSLRDYLANPNRFFNDHLKRYTKGRRYAPIYWPLATPSGSYTLWLYYHRLTDQTLYSCVNDFVDPKLKQVNEDVDTLRRRANRSRQEEKDLEQLSELALELAAFRDELLRIARFWQPNLNDGVQITAAPLWRLFQHRAWQKRLKETWAALEAGDYDWAHLAYSIWPERVREKCKTDKSLAIAHDLEHLYVEPVKPVKAKKGGRKKQQVDDDEQGALL